MKSNRQRRTELFRRRAKKRSARDAAKSAETTAKRVAGGVPVNPFNLKPTNSYGTPEFARRGFYVNTPFTCKDCGKPG